MITNTYDNKSKAIIDIKKKENSIKVDACIITFSNIIEQYILDNYKCNKIAEIKFVTGITPIYGFSYNGHNYAFFKTYVGGPACVGTIEDTQWELDVDKYILFGGAGCLNKEITKGKIMIPTEAYRDEGTSYHYAPASDYINIKNYKIVEEFMSNSKIPYVLGKTWTTDSYYRETINNFNKRKEDGCISVEMECASVEAMCQFRNLDVYTFFMSGDLLDAPEWDERKVPGQIKGTQHDGRYFDIALKLAEYIIKK